MSLCIQGPPLPQHYGLIMLIHCVVPALVTGRMCLQATSKTLDSQVHVGACSSPPTPAQFWTQHVIPAGTPGGGDVGDSYAGVCSRSSIHGPGKGALCLVVVNTSRWELWAGGVTAAAVSDLLNCTVPCLSSTHAYSSILACVLRIAYCVRIGVRTAHLCSLDIAGSDSFSCRCCRATTWRPQYH